MAQITIYPTEDARLYEPNQGAGKSDYLPVGLYAGGIYRSVLKFPNPDWTGLNVRRITAADFWFKQSSQNYIARGTLPRFLVRRLTESFGDEGSAVALSTSNNVRWDNKPASTSDGQADTGALPDVNGQVSSVSILTMMRRWAPTTVENGSGYTNYGIELRSFDEASTTRTTEIYSKDATTYDPRIIMVYETNTAPLAPTGRSPISDADGNPSVALVSAFGGTATLSFTRSDPDAGDYITAYQIQVFADSATDAVPGSALLDTGKVTVTGSPTSYGAAVAPGASLTTSTPLRWRVRTYDKEGAAGAWSTLADARIYFNTAPLAPQTPSVDPNSLTPTFYGSIFDPDSGSSMSGAQVQVYQDTAGGAIAKWDDDPDGDGNPYVSASGTRFSIAYGGSSALEWGVTYRYRSRIRDNLGTFGPWTSWISWTPSQVTGPTALSPISVETKLNTLSPTMTIGHSVAFDQYEVEVYRYNDLNSTKHYASGTTSVGSTTSTTKVVGPLPDWGRTYYWRARVRPTGGGSISLEPWSPLYPIYVNALPAAPVLTVG